MIRYRLDDLGWFQFEWLVQSLLKAELGLALESWGGSRDLGRDAYCSTGLPLTGPGLEPGPFIFQAKFVQAANAAGAKAEGALLDAVRAEGRELKARTSSSESPRHYFLLTNCPVSPKTRKTLASIIEHSLPGVAAHARGGADICDLLDKHAEIRRAFPQLLSLRDLSQLLGSIVNKGVLEKSHSALREADDHVKVFVPTSAYERAWAVLGRHSFVVLDGPPEMGKTAIAWMIAVVQVASEWQAIVCDRPEDFFELFESGSKQIFVADDAFGRTEYDPTRGRDWERQMDRVLGRIDRSHWLVWTSRKHILERALNAMDLQGKARKFPKPAEVVVEASELTVAERALILYRHSKAAGLEAVARDIVKSHSKLIVRDASFTPERIRRFVKEVLPRLAGAPRSNPLLERIFLQKEIQNAIRRPTERMEKTFRALPFHHKVVLLSLLDAGYYASTDQVRVKVEERLGGRPRAGSFDQVVEELSESFLRLSED